MTTITAEEREKILSFLESRLEAKVYDTWCRTLELERTGENSIRVPAPNTFYRNWLENLLRKPLEDAFLTVFGHVPEIAFHVSGTGPAVVVPLTPVKAVETPAKAASPSDFVLNPAYTFENFIEGPSNRMAYAAAVAVSENPAGPYNPLFIHGGVGLGKTHLLQAICRAVLARRPSAKVLYVSCEDFVNGYVGAIQSKRPEVFRARYRNADLLVVDDIHFLAGKEGSQEEFFHTFNALHLAGRQVILSSDQPAQDIRSLKQHLLSRFKSGFDATVMAPTYEMRLAILRRKVESMKWDVPQDVLGYIASLIETNIRELGGALTKVLGYASLSQRSPDVELAREALRDTTAPFVKSLSVSDIQQIVARFYNRKPGELQARRWTKSISQTRQICIYLCRKFTGASLMELGNHFGGKDHTTMLYSVRRVEKLISRNSAIRSDVERLKREISKP